MERFARAIIVAAASLATAWWLLHDPSEPDQVSASVPKYGAVLDPPGAGPTADAVAKVTVPEVGLVASVPSVAPVVGDEPPTGVATDASEFVEPIPLIEGITLPGGMWTLHTQMERQPRDVEWAGEMEQRFAAYFASKPELARNFGSPSVLCRRISCEIQAVGYGPGAFATWSAATEDLRDQPWANELFAGGIYTTQRAPNEQAVVLILMRTRRVIGGGGPPAR